MTAAQRKRKPSSPYRSISVILLGCAALVALACPSAAFAAREQGVSTTPRPSCLAGLDQMVSFDLRDTEVVAIFDLLARESNVNIVISPKVNGRITIRLENVSRWEALRHIVETMHLRMKEDGCVLRIFALADIEMNRSIAESEFKQREKEAEIRDKEAAARRKIAEALQVERAAAPMIIKIVPVRFAFDGKKLADDLQKLITPSLTAAPGVSPVGARAVTFPLEGGQLFQPEQPFVIYNEASNSIIIRHTEDKAEEIARRIRELDRETRQVLIEAKIVETTRSFTRDLGIQWGFLSRGITDRNFPATWGIQGGHFDNASPFLSPPLSGAGNWVINFPFTTTEGSITGSALGMTFANIANTFALDIQISAAEQNNDIRILSNPRIITSDNQKAMIKSGSEVPFQVQEEGGKFKVEFKDAVIQLEVTPHIVSDEMINMEVSVKKDEPDFTRIVQGNPSISKKEAKTRILMKDGDTLIIGGLTKDRQVNVARGVPWLSRVPVLKHLFSHTRNIKEFEEIMVFITPRMAPRLVSETVPRKDQPEGGKR